MVCVLTPLEIPSRSPRDPLEIISRSPRDPLEIPSRSPRDPLEMTRNRHAAIPTVPCAMHGGMPCPLSRVFERAPVPSGRGVRAFVVECRQILSNVAQLFAAQGDGAAVRCLIASLLPSARGLGLHRTAQCCMRLLRMQLSRTASWTIALALLSATCIHEMNPFLTFYSGQGSVEPDVPIILLAQLVVEERAEERVQRAARDAERATGNLPSTPAPGADESEAPRSAGTVAPAARPPPAAAPSPQADLPAAPAALTSAATCDATTTSTAALASATVGYTGAADAEAFALAHAALSSIGCEDDAAVHAAGCLLAHLCAGTAPPGLNI